MEVIDTAFPELAAAAEPVPAVAGASGTGTVLADGTPLGPLTWSRKSAFVQLVGVYGVPDTDAAALLLFLCSPAWNPRRRWKVPAPSETGSDPALKETAPSVYEQIWAEAEAWADDHLSPRDMLNLWDVAREIWQEALETMVVPAADDPGPEKKTSDTSPTGLNPTCENSSAGTSGCGTTCSTTCPPETPTPPSTPHGSDTASP